MADKTLTDRLQPSLLDRLTDDAPDQTEEPQGNRVIDLRRLREIVQRDLSWLLNTGSSEAVIDPELYPHAAKSTLNYGIGHVAGSYSTVERADAIRKVMQKAIEVFEPRIDPETLEVRFRHASSKTDTVINYDIAADMWAQPLPIELFLRSQVDLATGQLKLERLG